MMKRVLVSVSDKTNLVPFVKGLVEVGYEVISTGGTKKALEGAGIPVTGISSFTGAPEILGGRVKTLHPKVHGGLLALRDNEEHIDTKDIRKMCEMWLKENISYIELLYSDFIIINEFEL